MNKSNMSMQELDREQKRYEQAKANLRKLEQQYNMMQFLLKRVFRECFATCQKLRAQMESQENNGDAQNRPQTLVSQNFLQEGLNILNLNPDEIDSFLDPQSAKTFKAQKKH